MSPDGRGRWDLPAAAALWAGAAAWTWGRWADLWVDFGLELELPRRLAAGEVLYRDVFYKNGPLSPVLNSLVFKAFGPSLEALTAVNLAVSLAVLVMLHRLALRCHGRAAAAAVAVLYAGVFAFSQYLWTANFNFAAPYSHYQTHGLALGLAGVFAWTAWLQSRERRWAVLAGALLGLVFLTKLELFVPAAAAAGLAVAAASRRGPGWKSGAAAALGAFAAVPGTAFLLFAAAMPWERAARGVAGNWFTPTAPLSNPFYRAGLGLDAPWAGAAALLAGGAVLAACVAWALAVQRFARERAASPALLGALFLAHGAAAAAFLPLRSAALAVEPAVWALAALGAWRLLRRPDEPPLPALWAAYAAVLFGKMLLAPRFGQYGFVLALPGAALTTAWLIGAVPEWARRRLGGGEAARAVLAGLVAAVVAVHLAWSRSFNSLKTLRLAAPAGSVVTFGPESDERGLILNAFVEKARTLIPPEATLLAMPEGSMLNYLLGRRNPTPYMLFMPEDFLLFGGEEAVVERLERTPPDFVALHYRETREFGVGRFGSPGYGALVLDWVRSRYVQVGRVGADPTADPRFGIALWRRR